MRKLALLCGCAFLALPGLARAATITGNVEWKTSQAVTSDLTIAQGATLTVDAGVQVVVSPGVKIDVLGALRTTTATGVGPVVFRASDSISHWQGIVGETGSSLSLIGVVVRDTQQTDEAGIACYGCRLTLERSGIGQNPGGPAAALRIYSTPGSLVNGVSATGGVHVYAGAVTIQALTAQGANAFLDLDDGSVAVMYSEIGGPTALGTAATGRFAFGNDTLGGSVSLDAGRASFLNTIVFGDVTTTARRSTFPQAMTFGATMVSGTVKFASDPSPPPPTGGVAAYDATKLLGTGASSNTGFDTTGVPAYCQTTPCNIGPDPAPRPLQPGTGTSTALATDPAGGATAGQTITLTATVTPLGGDLPAGSVDFVDGSFLPGIPCASMSGCTLLATAAVGADGVARATVTLPAGPHRLGALFLGGTDPVSGQALGQSGSTAVNYPVQALAAPVLTAPADGATVVGTSVPLAVVATPGATITLSVDGTPQTLTPDATGSYSGTLSLAYGTHTLTATQTLGGATSPATAPVTVHLLPPAPDLATPADGATLHSTTLELTGSGVPGAGLAILVDGVAVPGAVDASGAFSLSLPVGWGPHQISVAQVAGGAQGPSTLRTLSVVPDAPALTAPADGATVVGPSVAIEIAGVPGATALLAVGGTPLGPVTLDATGHYAGPVDLPYGASILTVSQSIDGVSSVPSAPVLVHVAPAPPTLTAPADGAIVSGPVNLAGTGVAGATVDVLVDGALFTTTTADAGGAFDAPLVLAPGAHVLSLTQTVAGEQSAPTADLHVSVRPSPPAIATPADGAISGSADVQVSGSADPGVEVDVYDGATEVGTATAGSAGAYTLTVHLADGPHVLTAAAVAGTLTSLPSAAVHVLVDTTPPTSTAATDPAAAAWFRGPVHVTIAADDGSGSGVAAIHAEVNGADTGGASFDVTAEGATTVRYWAVDRAGNAEQPHELVIRIDESAPAVTCDAAPTGWSAGEVSVACTATDAGGSGLADAASFTLTTSVGAGNETSTASTGTRQVCDVAGNCTTAGPVTGLEVDRKAPAISATGGTYELGAPAAPTVSCADGGSGVASCTTSPVDTSTPGPHTFTVTAVDNVGNRSTATVPYLVHYSSAALCLGEPARAILPPFSAAGTVTAKGNSTVPVKFRVCDAAGRSVGTPGVVASFSPGTLAFRWDPTDEQWVANLSTRGLAVGPHRYAIALNDGTTIAFTVTVR